MAKHEICHIEWMVTDLARSKKFYTALFGWKFQDWGENYAVFTPTAGPGGGLEKVATVTPSTHPIVHVEVDDIDPYLAKAATAGGGVEKGKTEIPQVGWYALLKDPDGNVFGIYKSSRAA